MACTPLVGAHESARDEARDCAERAVPELAHARLVILEGRCLREQPIVVSRFSDAFVHDDPFCLSLPTAAEHEAPNQKPDSAADEETKHLPLRALRAKLSAGARFRLIRVERGAARLKRGLTPEYVERVRHR